MGYAWVKIGDVMAHVCGSGIGRKKHCRFCGRPSDALCDWPKMRRENVQFDTLKVGDLVLAFEKSEQPHRLVYLAPQPHLGEVWYATEWNGRVTERVESQPWRGIWVPKMGTCDAPCCARHRRHVGPDVDYCQRHWDAWQTVGS